MILDLLQLVGREPFVFDMDRAVAFLFLLPIFNYRFSSYRLFVQVR